MGVTSRPSQFTGVPTLPLTTQPAIPPPPLAPSPPRPTNPAWVSPSFVSSPWGWPGLFPETQSHYMSVGPGLPVIPPKRLLDHMHKWEYINFSQLASFCEGEDPDRQENPLHTFLREWAAR